LRTIITPLSFVLALAAAGSAFAQPATGLPQSHYSVMDVFANATIVVKLAFLLLAVGGIGALVTWALSLGKVGSGDTKSVTRALSQLKLVRSAAAPLGAMAGGYTLLNGFIGLANVSPTPGIAVLAHGWAESATAVTLGFLVMTIAVLCERHLEGRVRAAAA
jgi:hypothetical protein